MTGPEPALRPHRRVDDRERILEALTKAVREAIERHRVAGNPIAVWKNGRVEWIPPEDIPRLGSTATDE